MIARKEGKFHPISMTSNNMIPYEAGQRVWIQDPASKKWNPGSIKEKATEPNFYWVELNGAEYRTVSVLILKDVVILLLPRRCHRKGG